MEVLLRTKLGTALLRCGLFKERKSVLFTDTPNTSYFWLYWRWINGRYQKAARNILYALPTDRTAHTTHFSKPTWDTVLGWKSPWKPGRPRSFDPAMDAPQAHAQLTELNPATDFSKVKLQVDPIRRSQGSVYQGLFHAVRKISAEEGISAFWKGHVPAQALSIVYGVAQYTFFEALTKGSWYLFPESLSTEWRPVTHTVCGGLSGCISTLVVQPIDVIRTRFVAQGQMKIYYNVYQAFSHIVQQEGVRGLYRGLTPALSQIGPQMGLQFGLYSVFTIMWDSVRGTTSFKIPGPVESFFCGTGAGFLSKMIIYPLDVIKKRLQIQGFEKARRNFGTFHTYRGFFHCCQHILQSEGAYGLYKGLLPSVLKAGVVAGTIFCVYDQIIAVLILLHR